LELNASQGTPQLQRPLEDEEGAQRDQRKADAVVPGELLAQVEHGEQCKDRKGDDLLDGLELGA
jgi:hypothetical protein